LSRPRRVLTLKHFLTHGSHSQSRRLHNRSMKTRSFRTKGNFNLNVKNYKDNLSQFSTFCQLLKPTFQTELSPKQTLPRQPRYSAVRLHSASIQGRNNIHLGMLVDFQGFYLVPSCAAATGYWTILETITKARLLLTPALSTLELQFWASDKRRVTLVDLSSFPQGISLRRKDTSSPRLGIRPSSHGKTTIKNRGRDGLLNLPSFFFLSSFQLLLPLRFGKERSTGLRSFPSTSYSLKKKMNKKKRVPFLLPK